jgi:hypothetical protein
MKIKFAQRVFSSWYVFLLVCILSLISSPYAVGNIRGKPKNRVAGLFPVLVGRNSGWQFLEGANALSLAAE